MSAGPLQYSIAVDLCSPRGQNRYAQRQVRGGGGFEVDSARTAHPVQHRDPLEETVKLQYSCRRTLYNFEVDDRCAKTAGRLTSIPSMDASESYNCAHGRLEHQAGRRQHDHGVHVCLEAEGV